MVFVAIGTRTAYKWALNQIFKMTGKRAIVVLLS
jgi:hypothetical protein